MTTTQAWRATTYSLTDWLHDYRAKALPCPRCGHDEDYGARHDDPYGTKPPDDVRYYRACKCCGMFQRADGASMPYETRMHVHVCLSRVAAGAECRGCGNVRDGRPWHLCPRIIPDGEAFTCPECRTSITGDHAIRWPERGP